MDESTIFTEQVSRKPNRYPWTDQFIEAMHNGFWTDKDFLLSQIYSNLKSNYLIKKEKLLSGHYQLLVKLK